MNCEQIQTMLGAHLDGELSAVNDGELQEHLRTCPVCLRAAGEQQVLRRVIRERAPYHRAPEGLAARIRGSLGATAAPAREAAAPAAAVRGVGWNWFGQWLVAGAALAAVVFAVWIGSAVTARRAANDFVAEDIVSGHLRSLQAGHLTDVLSTDQHTVKPWFAGKADFSPVVKDFAADGFPLVGGRLDYLAGHPAAALVFQRNKHVINLFVWPVASGAGPMEHLPAIRGYNLITWQQSEMVFCAVSDLNRQELESFAEKYQGK